MKRLLVGVAAAAVAGGVSILACWLLSDRSPRSPNNTRWFAIGSSTWYRATSGHSRSGLRGSSRAQSTSSSSGRLATSSERQVLVNEDAVPGATVIIIPGEDLRI